MSRPLRWYDYITINVYYLGLTALSQTLALVYPLLVQRFVGESVQGAYLGNLRLWMLMVALLVQAFMGMLSDRSRFRWGRRRPFIFIGTLGDIALLAATGFIAGLSGLNGYWALFGAALLLQVATNTAHGAQQGLIPDLVSEDRRGKFSSIKAILELPVPLIVVSFTIARLINAGEMWAALIVTMGILVISMLITMFAPERPPREQPKPMNWQPIIRLAGMVGIFTVLILLSGEIAKLAGRLLAGTSSAIVLTVAMGGIGFFAMLLAIVLGVWFSVRASVGTQTFRQNPSFTWWVVNRLAFMVGVVNLSTFAVYFIQARLGFERETAAGPAAFLMMIVGVFILVSAVPSGWLTDRFGRKPLVAISGLVAALGTLIALLAPNIPVIYLGGTLIGIATGFFYTANWALGTDLVPKEEAGRYLGIGNLAGAGAGAVGAYIGGPIADYITVHVPQIPGIGYVVLFGIYGLLFLVSVLALSRVREPSRAPAPAVPSTAVPAPSSHD